MIGTDGIKYKLNRILRVTVTGDRTETIEYCPYDSELFDARIDATIKYIPMVQNKNGRPGFSAEVTIYNPPASLIGIISGRISWPIGLANGTATQKTVTDYYNMRCRVSIDAGYWDNGKRNYTNLFGGHLNTSSYYRKGTDNILKLMCHNVKLSPSDVNRMTYASYVNGDLQKAIYNQVSSEWGSGLEKKTWVNLADRVITEFETQKAPKVSSVVDDSKKQMSVATTIVTASDRKKPRSFYEIRPIKPPKDLIHPGNGSEPDYPLEVELQRTVLDNFVPHGNDFESNMQELVDSFPGPLRWKADYDFTDGYTRYYYWLAKGGGDSETASRVEKAGTITIYNFQNFLEAPSVDGSGCFTIKMLFNPAVWPNKDLMLKWDDKLSFGNAAPLTKGVSSTASLGQFYPSLQAGLYQAQVYAVTYRQYKDANGYLFNKPFRIAYVTHRLSSRGNSWSTEVKTVSMIASITKE